jgi:hypothetical protein
MQYAIFFNALPPYPGAYAPRGRGNTGAWPTRSVVSTLDVHFIYTLPVLVTLRHSRESGNPGDKSHGDWMPAFAGMTFYWCRTYETDI